MLIHSLKSLSEELEEIVEIELDKARFFLSVEILISISIQKLS
jgi:hypothetical protein